MGLRLLFYFIARLKHFARNIYYLSWNDDSSIMLLASQRRTEIMIRRKRQINLLVPNYRSSMVDQELIRTFSLEDKVIQDNGGAISTNHYHDCVLSEACWLSVAPNRNNCFFSVCVLCVCLCLCVLCVYLYAAFALCVACVLCVCECGVSCAVYICVVCLCVGCV